MKSVTVFAPASIGNLSCGFDVLGLAITSPGDQVTIALDDTDEIQIAEVLPANVKLPMEVEKNTAGVAVKSFLDHIGKKVGVKIYLTKGLPMGSGMGSSAASAVAAVVAINHLLGQPLQPIELLPHALEAERIACGSAHADNVAPCLLGGITLVREYNPLDVIKIPVAAKLFCTLVHPHFEIRTEDARRVLPKTVPLKDAITQSANTAGLMIGLMNPDYKLIGRSLRDVLAEPVRAKFIPGFYAIREKALEAGALGCGISGSGPTLFALSENNKIASAVGEAIKHEFLNSAMDSDIFISRVNERGAEVVGS